MKVSEGPLTVIAQFAGLNHEDFDSVTQAGRQALQDVSDAYASVRQARWCAQACRLALLRSDQRKIADAITRA